MLHLERAASVVERQEHAVVTHAQSPDGRVDALQALHVPVLGVGVPIQRGQDPLPPPPVQALGLLEWLAGTR